jgi:chromosome segregation ATPase
MSRRPDPTPAIEAKKAQATANRERLAKAIQALQLQNRPVNVQAVARAAGVHPDTLRRNPDLYAEVRRLRDQGWRGDPPQAPSTSAESGHRVRLLAAQSEIQDLRRQLAEARQVAHQTLGEAGAALDAQSAAELQGANAELTVQVADLQDQVRALRDERRDLGEELTAAHELNREYVRALSAANERLLQAERNLATTRSSKR